MKKCLSLTFSDSLSKISNYLIRKADVCFSSFRLMLVYLLYVSLKDEPYLRLAPPTRAFRPPLRTVIVTKRRTCISWAPTLENRPVPLSPRHGFAFIRPERSQKPRQPSLRSAKWKLRTISLARIRTRKSFNDPRIRDLKRPCPSFSNDANRILDLR